jgi:hypothetical protein
MIDFNKLMLEETEKLVKFLYNDEFYFMFQSLKINKHFKFRQEHLIQLFLYVHWKSKTHKCFEKNFSDYSIFLSFDPDVTEILKTASTKQNALFEKGCHKFNGWLHLMKLFIESNQMEISASFDTLCDGIAGIIEHLLQPEQFFLPNERGKPLPRPKYNPPAQTFLVIFC